MEGVRLPGLFEIRMVSPENRASLIKLIWALSLNPDYVRSLSLGANWNFCER